MLFDVYQKHSLFEKEFDLSLQISCSDNAGFKIIIFSQRLDILNGTAHVCFYGQTLSGRLNCFARLRNIFLRFLLLSIYKNTSEIIRACFRKKS